MTHLVPVIRPVLGTPFRRGEFYRRAGAMPAFHIAPASRQSAADLITGNVIGTYNSATPAMEVGPDGLLFTPAANAPVIGYDPVTLACRGVRIWSAVTNLLLNSATLSTQSRSVTAQAYTLHFTGTGTITLSGASTAGPLVGTGTGEANRVSLTFTPTAGTLTLTVSGTVSNAQLNTGGLAPYVPTTTTSASSTADVWSITGSDFTNIFNAAEGTVFVDYLHVKETPGYNNSLFTIASSSTSDNALIDAFIGNSTAPSYRIISAGVAEAYMFSLNHGAGIHRGAFAYKSNDCAKSIDSQPITIDTTVNLPAGLSQIEIGCRNFGGVEPLRGYIRELALFRTRRPNSNLQAMSL